MTDTTIIDHLKHHKYSLALKGLYNILPAVKKHVKANNGTAEDADDTFQDALVILYKKVHSPNFTLTAELKTYLLAIAKNCWFNELRKRKKIPITETTPYIADTGVNEEAGMLLASSAFELLGEKCKQLLVSFYFKKQSFREIATALSFSDEKVAKNQKYRCLQKAKENYLTLLNHSTHE